MLLFCVTAAAACHTPFTRQRAQHVFHPPLLRPFSRPRQHLSHAAWKAVARRQPWSQAVSNAKQQIRVRAAPFCGNDYSRVMPLERSVLSCIVQALLNLSKIDGGLNAFVEGHGTTAQSLPCCCACPADSLLLQTRSTRALYDACR